MSDLNQNPKSDPNNPLDRVEITVTLEGLRRLQKARVGIAGVGTLGGSVGFFLTKSQIGDLSFFDKDDLSEANIPRHICPRQYVGWPKVKAVAETLRRRGRAPADESISSGPRTRVFGVGADDDDRFAFRIGFQGPVRP